MRASSVEQVILDILSAEHAHMTSLQIYEGIRARLPAVNQSTIYRALERLVKNGKVSVSDLGTGAAIYQVVADGLHHHLVCQQCGEMLTIGDQQVSRFFSEIQGTYQFKVATNHLILFGTCLKCQGSNENQTA